MPYPNPYAASPGTYELLVAQIGFNTILQTLSVEGGRTIPNNVPLTAVSTTSNVGKVRGLVTGMDGAVISGALVRLYNQQGTAVVSEFTTGTDGAFSFSAAPGVYKLSVMKSGYIHDPDEITIKANFELVKDQPIGSKVLMTGTTILTTTQEALSNIQVSLFKRDDTTYNLSSIATFVTTTEGKFLFEQGPGNYEITAGSDDRNVSKYQLATSAVKILATGTISPSSPILKLSPHMVSGQPVQEHATGTVYDSFSKAPLEHVSCSLKGVTSVMTDLRGKFEFQSLLPATYELTFSKEGWATQTVAFRIEKNPETTTASSPTNDTIMTPSSFTVYLQQSPQGNLGAISGRFLDIFEVSTDTMKITGTPNRFVHLYVYRLTSKSITYVSLGATQTVTVSDWEFDSGTSTMPILSTITGSGTVNGIDMNGTFRLEHLQPTTSTMKYLVFVATTATPSESFLTPMKKTNFETASSDVFWWQENPKDPNRSHSWPLVDVTANTTTFLQNFNLPNY